MLKRLKALYIKAYGRFYFVSQITVTYVTNSWGLWMGRWGEKRDGFGLRRRIPELTSRFSAFD